MSPQPSYGSSDHYTGLNGRTYFAWQSINQDIEGAHASSKFAGHIMPSDTVVDFGCGSGSILKRLVCARRLGIDINPAARAAASTAGIEVFESLDQLTSHTADVLISHHALEHVPYPGQALSRMCTILKPNGALLLIVPIDDWRRERQYDPGDINHHLHTWTPLNLGHTLSEAGFRVVSLSIHFRDYFPWRRVLYPHLNSKMSRILSVVWSWLRNQREIRAIAVPLDSAVHGSKS